MIEIYIKLRERNTYRLLTITPISGNNKITPKTKP